MSLYALSKAYSRYGHVRIPVVETLMETYFNYCDTASARPLRAPPRHDRLLFGLYFKLASRNNFTACVRCSCLDTAAVSTYPHWPEPSACKHLPAIIAPRTSTDGGANSAAKAMAPPDSRGSILRASSDACNAVVKNAQWNVSK